LARGDGTFAEVAQFAGVAATEWTWAAGFLDVDLDGWEDLLVATGSSMDLLHADVLSRMQDYPPDASLGQRVQGLKRFPRLDKPKLAFRNQQNGTFVEVGQDWGFSDIGVANGMAWGDLDNDGDLDLVVNHLDSVAGVYRNIGEARGLHIRLKGAVPNTAGIGARITVTGGPVVQSQTMTVGGRYCSHSDTALVFAGGGRPLSVHVRWPDRRESTIDGIEAGTRVVVDASTARNADAVPLAEASSALFEDWKGGGRHIHGDAPYPDFERQPLLPNRMGSLGPGVLAIRLEPERDESFLVTGGKEGDTVWIHPKKTASGDPASKVSVLAASLPQEQAGGALWKEGGAWRWLSTASNWEHGSQTDRMAVVRDPMGSYGHPLPPSPATIGPVAAADVDGDGDIDLFTGFIGIPGRWPETLPSRLHLREGNGYRGVEVAGEPMPVMGAVFTDLTGDGLPELIMACDWGPVRILRWKDGQWADDTGGWGMLGMEGWWRGGNFRGFRWRRSHGRGGGKLGIECWTGLGLGGAHAVGVAVRRLDAGWNRPDAGGHPAEWRGTGIPGARTAGGDSGVASGVNLVSGPRQLRPGPPS